MIRIIEVILFGYEESRDGTMTAIPQGDVRLLETDVAKRLLASKEMARVSYTARDGTPRIVTMFFHWNGEEVVLSSFQGAYKIRDLQANPHVAISIDTSTFPPEILLIRGKVDITEVDGLTPEYVAANYRYGGPVFGAARVSEVDKPGVRMVRFAVRPSWVGVLDFTTRFPRGRTIDEFVQRGR
jgi:hypothetical protein